MHTTPAAGAETAGRVLVVEDEAEILEPLAYSLRKAGFDVLCAADGLTACRLIGNEQPDLILLDIMLPDLDGWDVCRMLRQHPDPQVASTPIIMLTALGTPEDKYRGLELGADLYLPKPYSIREVILLAGKFVSKRHREVALETRLAEVEATEQQNRDLQHLLFHELTNQLLILNGFTELLHAKPDRSNADLCLDAIYRSSNYLQLLAEEVLLIRQISDGRLVLPSEFFQIDELVREIIRVYQASAGEKNMQLRWLVAEKTPTVRLNRLAVKIILSALIDNAIKYGSAGQLITLRCATTDIRFELTVVDQGPGIPPEDQERIFEPYYRQHGVQGKPTGRGLGLYGVRMLARAMGGATTVESEAGRGSCFRVNLPVEAGTQEPDCLP